LRIERIQVEEGFLDGLDISFAAGLNVIIGARGVGKTSILELIRFALRLPHIDENRIIAAKRHAEGVLGGGRVTVSYIEDGRIITTSRTASDPDTFIHSGVDPLPTSIGQNELEGIGLNPRSRIRLIDNLARVDENLLTDSLSSLQGNVLDLSEQIHSLSAEREGLRQQDIVSATVAKQLAEARDAESNLLSHGTKEMAQLRELVQTSAAQVARIQQRVSNLADSRASFGEIERSANRLSKALYEAHIDFQELSGLERHLPALRAASDEQEKAVSAIRRIGNEIDLDIEESRHRISAIDDEARPLRQEFDRLQQGAGAAAQLTARLQQQLEELQVSRVRLKKIEARIDALRSERAHVLARIDEVREVTWLRRKDAAAKLTEMFAPRINIRMDHYGDRTEYTAALAVALKGSGLQHNVVAEWTSERMSPEELVNAIELGDVARLATLGELTAARVDKMVNYLLGKKQLSHVLTAAVDDTVDFELAVGGHYRATEKLSTGQRCSVVLPILLADEDRTLLLDQPEDHLDNAYLVENTVGRLRARSAKSQTIVVTHNANIPVLGEASRVFALDSDGRRGFIRKWGELSDLDVVESITNLMEGGRDAFDRRAAFYGGI
jgi:hypothetical protein